MVGVLESESGKLLKSQYLVMSTSVKLRGTIVESAILCYVAVKTLLSAPLNSGIHYCSTGV